MAYLLVFLPLIASFVVGIFGKKIGDKASQIITCSFVGISTLISFYFFLALNQHTPL